MTKEMIETASYQKLVSLCPKNDVKYKYQDKKKLQKIFIQKLDNKDVDTTTHSNEKKEKYGSKVISIIDSDLTKSDKMRSLYNLGIQSPSEISRLTDSHYSFVFTVISKYRKVF